MRSLRRLSERLFKRNGARALSHRPIATPASRRGRWRAAACALVCIAGLGAGQALAATCAPAASGGSAAPDWPSFCWLDFTSYNDTLARSPSGQGFTFALNDGSTLSLVVNVSTTAATALKAVAAPARGGAAVGNTAFLGIPGSPILYTATNASTVTVTFSGITLVPPVGVSGGASYSFVAADGESTNTHESLAFTTNGGNWTVLDQVPPISGNLYPATANTGTTFTETGVAGTVGGYIVGSINPTQVSTTLVAGGLQGAMFALRYSAISLNKTLVGTRVNAADQFTYKISATSSGHTLGSATSSGSSNGPFGQTSSFITTPQSLTVSESMAAGSVSTLASYGASLSCTNSTAGSPTPLPNNVATTSYVLASIAFGDVISCSFTNTAHPSVLAVTKSAPSPSLQVGVNSVYTLTVTNSGLVAATTAQVKDQLPANLTFVSATGTNWICSNASSLITCAFAGGTIASGGTSTIAVTVTAAAAAAGASDTNYASIDPTGGTAAPAPGSTCAPTASCASSGPYTVIYINPLAESGTAAAGTASTPIANVASNDTVNGAAATLGTAGNATVAQSGTWPAGIALNTTSGAVTTTAAVAPGSYSLVYQLCDKHTPPDCATATDTVTVTGSIAARPDTGTAVAGTASTPIANVASNDTVNGAAATLGTAGNATVAQSGTWAAGIALNTTSGAVTTTAAAAPGSYSLIYQLCDRHTPPDCAAATDTVTVSAAIVPVAHTGTAVAGTASTPVANVAANGTVNGAAATLGTAGNATVAQSGTWPTGIALNTATGAVTTTAAVAPGTYSLAYQLCDKNTPANCSSIADTIKVSASILPTAAAGTAVTGTASTPIANVASNDTVNGAAATLGTAGNATVAQSGTWAAGIALNTATGAVTTTAAVLPGTYSLSYVLCDRNAPPTCGTAIATVVVKNSTGGLLLVEKSSDKTQAEVGDSVQYRIQVRNPGTGVVVNVTLDDALPLGFKLVPGTVLIGRDAAVPTKSPDPQGTPGPALTWTLGNIGPGEIIEIDYRVRIAAGAERGDGTNRAQAFGLGVASPVAIARVRISGGAFATDACVVGKIYVDCNGNRVQDAGEPGIPGVRLYFEDGTNLTSDENGNYSLCGQRPVTHVLKVDQTTLPAGSRLVVLSSRNAGDGDSVFVDLREGELHRADFAEGSCTNKVMEDVKRRHQHGAVLAPLPPTGRDHLGVDFESTPGTGPPP